MNISSDRKNQHHIPPAVMRKLNITDLVTLLKNA